MAAISDADIQPPRMGELAPCKVWTLQSIRTSVFVRSRLATLD